MALGGHLGGLIGSHLGDGSGGGGSFVGGRGPAGSDFFVLDIESNSSVTYEWSTNTIPARGGAEKRISLIACPRETYKFKAVLEDAQLRTMQSALILKGAQAQPFLLGLMHEGVTIVADSTTSAVATVNTTQYLDWLYPGSRAAVLDRSTGVYKLGIVQSSGPTTVQLDATIGAAGKAGAVLMPTMPCLLASAQKLGLYAVNAGTWDLEARALLYGDQNGSWTVNGATVTTYNGVTVFDRPHEANALVGRAIAPGVEMLDAGGAISAYGPRASAQIARQVRYTIRTDADRQWFKAFLGACVGKQKVFFLPSWKPDFAFTGDASAGTLTFTGSTIAGSAGLNYVGAWGLTGAHGQVQLRKTDGTIAYRTVTTYADNGNGTQTITLDSALAGALDMVSLLEKCRLDQDAIPVTWISGRGTVDLQTMVVKQ